MSAGSPCDPALLDHPLRKAGSGDHDRVGPGGCLDLTNGACHGHGLRVAGGQDLDLLEPGSLALLNLLEVGALSVGRSVRRLAQRFQQVGQGRVAIPQQ